MDRSVQPVQELYRLTKDKNWTVSYDIKQTEPANSPTFITKCEVDTQSLEKSMICAIGKGRKKKLSKTLAAEEMLALLQQSSENQKVLGIIIVHFDLFLNSLKHYIVYI